MNEILGIIGGMGPLASAQFVQTIYHLGQCQIKSEQEAVNLQLSSLSQIPDRTQSLKDKNTEQVLVAIDREVKKLVRAGCSKVVICCYTAHALFRELETQNPQVLLSLVDLAEKILLAQRGSVYLLATKGSYENNVFLNTFKSSAGKEKLKYPSKLTQGFIHNQIYEIKTGKDPYQAFQEIFDHKEIGSFKTVLFGCTELHLLTNYSYELTGTKVIDPLWEMAHEIISGRVYEC